MTSDIYLCDADALALLITHGKLVRLEILQKAQEICSEHNITLDDVREACRQLGTEYEDQLAQG